MLKTKRFLSHTFLVSKNANTKRPTGSLETSLAFWLMGVGLDGKHTMKGPGFDMF